MIMMTLADVKTQQPCWYEDIKEAVRFEDVIKSGWCKDDDKPGWYKDDEPDC